MTGSHPQPAPHRETGTEDANDHLAIQAESRTSNFDLPALNSMRPTAPPSRPYGRYAVGLRPSLDPDACFDAPSQDKEARRTNQNNTEVGLDWPPSFRNDLRLFKLSHAMSSSVCLKLVSFFRAALMSCSSLVSLRAVYRDCLVSVEHCSVTVTMGFASGRAAYRHHCFTDAASLKETDR